jgi:hypothetical protein
MDIGLLFGYFRVSYEKAYLPSLEHLLLEYIKIADLIRHRIVVPISDEVHGFYARNSFTLSHSERREVANLLASIPRFQKEAEHVDLHGRLGSLIKEQLWLKQRMENRTDLYFPNDTYVPILQGILKAASHPYASNQIYEPSAVGILADLAHLDTSQISIMDIITIRSENAFSDYRSVLQRILQQLQDREGNFSDLETEFAVAAREEIAKCGDGIKQLTKKSPVLKDTLNNLGRVLIGGATCAIGPWLDGSPEISVLSAAAGAAVLPLYDILRGAWATSPNSAARASLRHHFLVLNSGDSEGPH